MPNVPNMIDDEFRYDVFLSHSAKDKAVVRAIAERLRADGLRVWFDEWIIKPGDSIPAKIEDGLEQSRVLVLCLSAQAFGSDWARLESYTFRFRDQLNQARRFLPLRLDDADIQHSLGSLAQYSYLNWLPEERETEYAKLLDACRPSAKSLAGQICRELTVSDHGIDMEIEFKSDAGEATGRKLYLQLKSGDSYLKPRQRDGAEVFTIKDERHVRYWMAQAFPVLLVVRNSAGEVRWMEVRDYLQRASDGGKQAVKQIAFAGERFDVMSVRRWRERILQ